MAEAGSMIAMHEDFRKSIKLADPARRGAPPPLLHGAREQALHEVALEREEHGQRGHSCLLCQKISITSRGGSFGSPTAAHKGPPYDLPADPAPAAGDLHPELT